MLRTDYRLIFKVIDANLNRVREGLRVCEDLARFTISDKDIAKSLKIIRHSATNILLQSTKIPFKEILETRDTKRDVLRFVDFKKSKKADISDIFMANIERVKESLRVIEECCKVIDKKLSYRYRRLRFDAYELEKTAARKMGYISGNG